MTLKHVNPTPDGATQGSDISSKRRFLKLGLFGAVGAALLAGCAKLGLPKAAKSTAGYEDRAKGQSHCHDCVHFEGPHGCSLVEGPINPMGVCNYFLHA